MRAPSAPPALPALEALDRLFATVSWPTDLPELGPLVDVAELRAALSRVEAYAAELAEPQASPRYVRADTGKPCEPASILWGVPKEAIKVRRFILHDRPAKGLQPFMPVSPRWAVRLVLAPLAEEAAGARAPNESIPEESLWPRGDSCRFGDTGKRGTETTDGLLQAAEASR